MRKDQIVVGGVYQMNIARFERGWFEWIGSGRASDSLRTKERARRSDYPGDWAQVEVRARRSSSALLTPSPPFRPSVPWSPRTRPLALVMKHDEEESRRQTLRVSSLWRVAGEPRECFRPRQGHGAANLSTNCQG